MRLSELLRYSIFSNLAYVRWDSSTVGRVDLIAQLAEDEARLSQGMSLNLFAGQSPSWGIPAGSIHPNDPTGFAANLFVNGEEKVLAIRGTEFEDTPLQLILALQPGTQLGEQTILDLFGADLEEIVGLGLALRQSTSLLNYVLRAMAPAGAQVAQYALQVRTVLSDVGGSPVPPGLPSFSRGDAGPAAPVTWYWLQPTVGEGLGLFAPGEQITVVGHSLAGHLAALALRLFPNLFSQAVLFNAAGFDAPGSKGITDDFVRIVAPLLPAAPAADFVSFGNRLQNYASESSTRDDDIAIVPSPLTGIARLPPVELLRTETNSHGMDPLMDSVAVLATLERLAPGVERTTLYAWFDAASPVAGDSAERLVGALGELLLPQFAQLAVTAANWVGYGTAPSNFAARSALHDVLLALDAAAAARPALRLVSVLDLDDATFTARARESAAYRHALREYLPFAVLGDDALYARPGLAAALAPDAMTLSELADRVSLYRYEMQRRLGDLSDGYALGTVPLRFNDLGASLQVLVRDVLPDFEGPIRASIVFGTDAADRGMDVAGSALRDRIHGGLGDDWLGGNLGDDYLDGGPGDDVLAGGAGRDTLEGGTGDDVLYGTGPDAVDDGQTDVLIGGDGHDFLHAGRGDLVLDATGTLRVMIAGRWSEVAARPYVLLFDDGVQRVLQSEDEAAVVLAYHRPTRELRVGDITIAGFLPGDLGLSLAGEPRPEVPLPSVVGTAGADVLRGTPTAERMLGNSGDDTLTALEGDDRLLGDTGHDTLDGGTGDDLLDGGDDRDTLLGGGGRDTLRGGEGNDALAGAGDDDLLDGGAGDDVLGGGGGRDVLLGGAGDDLLSAELEFARAGADWIIERHGPAFGSLLRDPRAIRLLGFAALDLSALNRPRDASGDVLDGGAGADLLFGSAGMDVIEGGDGDDTALGGDGADLMYGGAGDDHLRGNGGSDSLFGGDGDDFLVGHGAGNEGLQDDGADRLDGGNGDDQLQGGAGADLLSGGDGQDRLFGDESNDTLDGGRGDDQLVGDDGDDQLAGSDGDDRLFGAAGDDWLDGGQGADHLDGGDGVDLLLGGGGDDTLHGGDGDDRLNGGDGDDVLLGGTGADVLEGSAGDDALDGGHGHDVYRVQGASGHDRIVDAGGFDELYLPDLRSPQQYTAITDGADLLIALGAGRSVRIERWRLGTLERLHLGEDWVLDGRHLDTPTRAGRVRALSAAGGATLLGTPGDDDIVLDASADQVSAGAGGDRYRLAAGVTGIELRIDDVQGANTLHFSVDSPAELDLAVEGEDYVIDVAGNRLRLTADSISSYVFADGTTLSAASFRAYLLNTVPLAPTLAQPLQNRALYLGQGFDFGIPAGSFIDLNPHTTLRYEAVLASGNPLPVWLRFDEDTGRFAGRPPVGAEGSYAVRVTAVDTDGLSVSDSFGLDVLPTLQRAPGALFAHQWVNGVNGFWMVTPEAEGTTRAAPLVAALGDLNADGHDDFIVGDSVRFGRAGGFGSVLGAAALDGYGGFRLLNYVSDGFRYADSGLLPIRGDFNNDGIDDVLLPSPSGAATDHRVLFGRRGRFPSTIDRMTLPALALPAAVTTPPLIFEGRLVERPSVRLAGDFNRDGRDDWLVHVAGDSASRSWQGVVFGAQQNTPISLDVMDGRRVLRLTANAYAGYPDTTPDAALAASGWGPLLPLGDVNGDGHSDIGFGSAPFLYASQTVYGAVIFGRADGYGGQFDLSQLNGANGFLASFPSPGVAYSAAHLLRAAGDINGDGYDDVFAIDDANGAAYAIYGRAAFSGTMHAGTSANDVIHAAPDTLTHAGPGDDTIYVPMTANGIVYGGGGRNAIVFLPVSDVQGKRIFHIDAYGGLQEDTYVVVGDTGLVRIHLHDAFGAPNRLVLGAKLSAFQFLLRQGSVTLDFGPDGPQIHLEDVDLDNVLDGPRTVDVIEFADGRTLSYAELIARGFDVRGSDNDEALRGSDVVDRIVAFAGHDTLTGGRGDDVLEGGLGNDVYVQAAGDGRDVIRDAGGSDRVRWASGLTLADIGWRHELRDLVLTYVSGDELRLVDWHVNRNARIERFEFANGTLADVERLVNRAPIWQVGAQTVYADAGTAFRYALPSSWAVDSDPLDRLSYRLRADSAAGTTSVPSWMALDGATRSVAGTVPAGFVGSVNLRVSALDPQAAAANLGLRFEFGSGRTLTGTTGPDRLTGTPWSDVLIGNAGADVLDGRDGHDRLVGGSGGDVLRGGPGNDTYVFTRGSGVDRIDNQDAAGNDVLLFDDPLATADLWFARQGSDLVLTRSGEMDRVSLAGWYADERQRVDRVVLDNEYALIAADVDRLVEAMAQFGPAPALGNAFAAQIAEPLAPVLASVWRRTG